MPPFFEEELATFGSSQILAIAVDDLTERFEDFIISFGPEKVNPKAAHTAGNMNYTQRRTVRQKRPKKSTIRSTQQHCLTATKTLFTQPDSRTSQQDWFEGKEILFIGHQNDLFDQPRLHNIPTRHCATPGGVKV